MAILFQVPWTWKHLWEIWNLRVFIILSLSLQIFLILYAPLRKRVSSVWITLPLWSAYLLADWVATFAIGLISSGQINIAIRSKQGDLLAFWAPFLLVHLGGPDTITAFSLEDNELWLRHLLGLLFQCFCALYVFFQTLPKNSPWPATIFMFLSGIIKYAERTRSLYLACTESFRESILIEPEPGPNNVKLVDEYNLKKKANIPVRLKAIREHALKAKQETVDLKQLNDLEIVLHAHRYFETFKGLFVDLIFSSRQRKESRDFFLARSAKEAFRIVEVELNFIYEALYTKVVVVHWTLGYFCRFLSFSSTVVALVLFYLANKEGINKFEVRVTYTLLWGAIALDTVAFIMIIRSDWTVVALSGWDDPPRYIKFLKNCLNVKDSKQPPVQEELPLSHSKKLLLSWIQPVPPLRHLKNLLHRKWGQSVPQYNLLYCCLHQRSECGDKVISKLGLRRFFNSLDYSKTESFNEELRNFLFEQLKLKSQMADDLEAAKEIYSAKGELILQMKNWYGDFSPYIVDVDYDESLLMWHIATDICYNTDDKRKDNNDEGRTNTADEDKRRYCSIAKLLSEYMLCLLVLKPGMMPATAGFGQTRFLDTCAEVKKFFREADIRTTTVKRIRMPFKGSNLDDIKQPACENILNVYTKVKSFTVEEGRKSILLDASILAKELMPRGDKWEIMSCVWVELLSYAASHCRPSAHAQQLSHGGELISLVWLLIAHFGLGAQFQLSEARLKLVEER